MEKLFPQITFVCGSDVSIDFFFFFIDGSSAVTQWIFERAVCFNPNEMWVSRLVYKSIRGSP